MIRAVLSRPLATRPLALVLACATLASLGLSSAAQAKVPPVPGGKISTLKQGRYKCELPGDAGGEIGKRVPKYDFTIVNASSYKAGGVRGSYLHTGTQVVMTGGTLQGMHFERVTTGFLRATPPLPEEGALRCVLSGPN